MKINQEIPNEVVMLGARTFLLPNNITHLEADVNYTNVYTANGKYNVLSTTMQKVMTCLSEHGDFVRISRKHVVNMQFAELQNDMEVKLEDGKKLKFSRRGWKRFSENS